MIVINQVGEHCEYPGCTSSTGLEKCMYYDLGGTGGCNRKVCCDHQGKRDCLLTRKHERRPTPCVDCAPKAIQTGKGVTICFCSIFFVIFCGFILFAVIAGSKSIEAVEAKNDNAGGNKNGNANKSEKNPTENN